MKNASAFMKRTLFITLTIVLIYLFIGGFLPNRLARYVHWGLATVFISIFAIVGTMLVIRIIQSIIRGVKRLKKNATGMDDHGGQKGGIS